jgi:phosphoserine phosphatase RsbU/P
MPFRVSLRLLALLALCCFTLAARAQAPASPQPAVRYHYGDNLQWADPDFDDSSWPVAQNGFVPSRSRDANRFLWVRIRVPVPGNLNGPLALHIADLGVQPMTWQVFLNGQPLGGQGAFPPHANPAAPPVSPVMPVPRSLSLPGSTALVSLREWNVPAFLESRVPGRPAAVIDDARVLELAVRAGAAETQLANGPEYALCVALALAGVILLVFWRSSRRPEYLWAAIMLLSPLFTAMLSSGPVTARLSFRSQTLAWSAVFSAGLLAEIEFMWTLFQLRSRWLRILWHTIWIAFILAMVAEAYTLQSPALQHLCQIIILAGIPAFDCILFPICIREMFRPNGNRAIAAAQSLFEVIVALGFFGYSVHLALGPFRLDLFNLALMLVDLAIGAVLFRRAWKAWKESSSLHAEFEAAREVQQQLVAAPPATPGFRIESAYLPATQVGGDFYHVLPCGNGEILVIVGDVSGKGLRAAMTVSAIIGSLRTLPVGEPAAMLDALNRSLIGRLHGGFVTCLAARLRADGFCSLANAGHLAPYRSGEEIPLSPGLPLGIIADAGYTENTLQLAPGDTLTFLSDGVVEAQLPTGELFGFDRTRAISSQSAQSIADAAQRFGQEDDITVLTLQFAPASAPYA